MKVTNLITPDVLAGIDDINRKCHAMHLPSPPVQFINAEVCDDKGAVVEALKCKSNSWVRNTYNVLSQTFLPSSSAAGSATFGEGSQSLKTTADATIRHASYVSILVGGAFSYTYNTSAEATYGIVVGTSDGAESFDSVNLGTKIAHGTSAGQLSYSAGSAPTVTYNPATKKWQSVMSRTFANGSGGSITVKEIGIIYNITASGYTPSNVLMSRDVLATPITVANGQTLTITYTSEITYPA